MASEKYPDTWYECDRCTVCCKWPGDVKVDDEEIEVIAQFLGMTTQDFIDQFTRLRMNRQGLSLIEKENHECIMLDGKNCKINPVKPNQCRGFPNSWNFPGWQNLCHAKPIPKHEAISRGLVPDDER